MKRRHQEDRGRRGVILLMVTGMIFVLMAFVGLAFDVGYLQWQRRRAQNAADGAAMSGAWAIRTGGDMVVKGRQGSALNGFTHAANGIDVTINHPPTLGAYVGNNNYVEAIVNQDAPSFFTRFLSWNSLPVRARAVANTIAFDTACVFALDTNARPALTFSGTSNLSFGCGVVSESTQDPATTISGNTNITVTNGATIGSVGQTVTNGGGSVTPSGSVASGLNSPGDPLSALAMPTTDITANCYQGTAVGMAAGPCADHSGELPTGGSYQPGVYCGGISINGSDSASFAPGLYILAGRPGLTINTSGAITGNGISFYLTDTTGWNCTGLNGSNADVGAVTMNGQATITWDAPLTGTYAGILIFSNRALPAPHSDINGGANSTLNGVFYFPNSDLSFSGSSSADGYMMILAKTVAFTGTTTMNLNDFPEAFANNNPTFKKWVTLAE
jgi:hypothetical protein